MTKIPDQRWRIAKSAPEKVTQISLSTGLLPLVSQVLVNRGINTPDLAQIHLDPELQKLPAPLEEFADLATSVELLTEAIALEDKIAICGDYDADGMTSTALLIRALRHLGADVDYAIPSRMKDGYGINQRIVEEFAATGVGLILTVDNGIAAYEPILHAVELGLSVIITDHHDLPPQLPPADAILNPKLLPPQSPYRGLAGVGVAYILAIATAQSLGKISGLTNQILELFTLGTIADLAPLVGVNRRWLKKGLRQLPHSQLAGIKALMQVAGVKLESIPQNSEINSAIVETEKQLQPDDIGFKLGPRINAIGRIGDPQLVIELLTTDDPGIALERAMQCEQINSKRQQLCEQIQQEAVVIIETKPIPWQQLRVLVVVAENWHHGVIGIVASRLVERYGVPVFIGTYEDTAQKTIRGSTRGIEEFNIFAALEYCHDLLEKYGGHKAAGGFSFKATNLANLVQKLSEFAHQCLAKKHLKPLVKIDAQAKLAEINLKLYQQIDNLQPWGIGNDFPIFWTPNIQVKEQKIVGKNHLKLILEDPDSAITKKAIAWRWGEYFPLPKTLDIAYKLKENTWNGNTNIELEIVGIRHTQTETNRVLNYHQTQVNKTLKKARFDYQGRLYTCVLQESPNELRIRNQQGKVLAISKGDRFGLLGTTRNNAKQVNVTQPYYFQLIKAALTALANK
ncbi:MAG TPA: single-stranded-DNA-specific exonuclease RecJ [Xenococcaceae cyanobacterium]